MEKYEAPAAASADASADAAEPSEGAEDSEDANAHLYIETSEALKDIVDAALQVSGLQVRTFIPPIKDLVDVIQRVHDPSVSFDVGVQYFAACLVDGACLYAQLRRSCSGSTNPQ
jgi:hypothetical protein